jgi:chemotaxis protein MotB
VIIVALLCVLFVLWSVSQQHRERVEALRVAWVATTSDLAAATAKLASLQQTNADLRDRILELEKEKVLTVKMARSLEDEMRAALESKDVTISKLQGKLTVNILDRILFDSGEAVVQPDGEAVLQKIAGILKQHPELKIHVIGHTDNVPLRPGARSRFASNWELSTARALAAVRFLTERASIAPQRLGAVGYGEFRPIADNATPEGRARNRRIAITILPDELAVADTIPTPTTTPISTSTTNAPAAN